MGSFKLGKMTLKSLFTKPITVKYPFEEPEHPAALRGMVSYDHTDCNYCGVCAKRCPTGCIEVDRQSQTWSINHFGCIQCASCVRECPKSCLGMEPVLKHPSTQKSVQVCERPEPTEEEKAELARKEAEKAARIKAAKEAKAAKAKAAAESSES